MEYTYAENQRWWATLTMHDRAELLATIIDKARNPELKVWAEKMTHVVMTLKAEPLPNELVKLRKWASD